MPLEWNVSSELMAKIHSSIAPVQTDAALRTVLAEDFPRDCSNLPISGGWGYTQMDAVVFVRDQFPIPAVADFVSLEYHIAQKIIFEELIIFRKKPDSFSGIEIKLDSQSLSEKNARKYDFLKFLVTCWSDCHWDQLKKEWEENDFGARPGFDAAAHAQKRQETRVGFERHFWFDITDVW